MTLDPVVFSIPGIPATKKTGQRIITNRGTGKPMVIPKQRTLDWTATAQVFMKRAMRGRAPLTGPVSVTYRFFRDNRADLGGLEAALDDAMQGIVLENDRQIVHRQSWKFVGQAEPHLDAVVQPL